jgi:hypothetical protein
VRAPPQASSKLVGLSLEGWELGISRIKVPKHLVALGTIMELKNIQPRQPLIVIDRIHAEIEEGEVALGKIPRQGRNSAKVKVVDVRARKPTARREAKETHARRT